jgi:3-phosphoshikimate 1-carboxyvinyltransferase
MEMTALSVSHPTGRLAGVRVPLPSSKSESNRALIIQALAREGRIQLGNLSSARDTQTMIRLLQSSDELLDVLDAGTTMRFLTAFCAAKGRKAVLTGTARMQQRPIALLVDALRALGARIAYLGNEGFPPIRIEGFAQTAAEVRIRGDVSSQYISALLMIAPTLPQGLTLHLEGEIGSKPYIDMTLRLMSHFGVQHVWQGAAIAIAPQPYTEGTYVIESDWSGASYWYSMAALAQEADVFIEGLREHSWQGDNAIVEIMEQLGVATQFAPRGVQLTKKEAVAKFQYDFTHCPDLAQTIAVICAAKGIPAVLTGLKSLRIKETDRIAALQRELEKFGTKSVAVGDEALRLYPDSFRVAGQEVHTYDDHRMAMAFAPLALLGPLSFDDAHVVRKSYPSYWDDLRSAGFVC